MIDGCAAARRGRPKTWINGRIRRLYGELFDWAIATRSRRGATADWSAGSTACALGAAFFGESMFSRERDASKVALVHLVARLKAGGFRLLDTQFTTPHLKQFGAIDVDRRAYQRMLEDAIGERGRLLPAGRRRDRRRRSCSR